MPGAFICRKNRPPERSPFLGSPRAGIREWDLSHESSFSSRDARVRQCNRPVAGTALGPAKLQEMVFHLGVRRGRPDIGEFSVSRGSFHGGERISEQGAFDFTSRGGY